VRTTVRTHRTDGELGSGPEFFLAVARTGSFRAAAAQLGMSANFLSKRISVLGNAYKTPLMTRHVDGIRRRRKASGARCRQADEEASFSLDRARERTTPALTGEVRLA